jgi:hypothetical protein
MKKGTGLSDNQRTTLVLIFALFNSVSASVLALQGEDAPPRYVSVILNIIGNAVIVVTVQLGIRDASTAAVAKTVKPELKQYRKPSASQINGLTDD